MKQLISRKNIIRQFVLVALLSTSFFYAKAQTEAKAAAKPATGTAAPAAPAVKGATSIIDSFFKKYKEDGTGPAIDYLFGTNKLFTDTVQIGVLKSKLDALRQTLGDYQGKELIAQKSAAASLVFYSYLVKHEKSPVRFTFMFYKPKNEWVLYRFKYDDAMDAELEDAGKINNKRQ
jgi:hypothetical protein